jgi:DNA-binding LacI/PurR family transcriptional regulator
MLTTISQPIKLMGAKAVDLLIEEMKEEKTNKERLLLSPKLIIRQSTAKFNTDKK